MIGSFPITFAKHQASHHKLRIWKMRKIPCWLQDYGLLFLSPRMPQVLGRLPAPSSALGAQIDLLPIFMKKASYGNILNTLFCHFYSFCISEENESDIWNNMALKWIERWKIHETKRSAAVSSMWTLAQMTQMVVFRYAHSIFLG